jgi:hypothetical protein
MITEQLVAQENPKKEKKPKVDEEIIIQTSFFETKNLLFEEIYKPNEPPIYACWDGKEVKYFNSYENEQAKYTPIYDDLLRENAIKLSTGVEEYVSTEKLVGDIQNHIRKYLDIPDLELKQLSYVILLSWVYDKANNLMFPRALGDYGTGKSRFLDTIGGLCYKSCSCCGAVTPAVIYRVAKKWAGTLVIDEADLKRSDENNEIVTILNCRYERNRPVLRCSTDKADNFEVQAFDIYGPTVLGTRQEFKDRALESRCLTTVMRQTMRKDIPVVLPKEFYEEQTKLRNKLLLWRFKNYYTVRFDKVLDLDVEPRLKQVTQCLIGLFDEKTLADFKVFLLEYQNQLIEKRADSFDGQIANAVLELYGEKIIQPSDIAKHVSEIEGFEVNSRTIGKHLRSLGINVSKPKRVPDKDKPCRCIELTEEQFSQLRSRYSVTCVTNVTCVTGKGGVSPEVDIIAEEPINKNLLYTPNRDVTNVTTLQNKPIAEPIIAVSGS